MSIVYLIPSLLEEEGLGAIHPYTAGAVKECDVFFVENERTARRFFKQLWKEMIIDDYEWHTINDASLRVFRDTIKTGQTIGIVSEAGCPGVADPGQALVAIAQEMNAVIKPLVGPNSILLALMASGLNGQQFRFSGYLPIDAQDRRKSIKELEAESQKRNFTQIFIETPYRNNQLLDALVKTCNASTKLCIAVALTGKKEWIKTKTIAAWQNNLPDIHKQPAIFLLYAGT